VLIYLKKAEMLMKMEELPQPDQDKEDVYVPPALPLPFRFEHTTTTVNDLIEALEKALTERSQTLKPKLPVLPSPIPDFLDVEEYLLEIESRADDLLEEIIWRYNNSGAIRLSTLVHGQEWREIVRIFMMLLFLAQRLKIDLSQDEEELDILISLNGEND
jgi:chromatin segregation and condensation protein Rec8/ScpA/Scc1 (kleisin family)